MRVLLIGFLLSISLVGVAQKVPSSCNAPDSIKQLYQDDADRMAVRYVRDNSTTWKDSARIEPSRTQMYMDVLMAVYNADSLPGRDTVVDLLNIHTSIVEFTLDVVNIFADTNLAWMQAIKNGNLTTGNRDIDSLLSDYSLDSSNTVFKLSTNNGIAELFFKHNHNLFALSSALEQQTGVVQVTPSVYSGGEGINITDTSYSGFTEITYHYGWVDCIIDCWYWRYWVFKVYSDCSVEYVRSYGDKLPADIGVEEFNIEGVVIYPNPVRDKMYVSIPQESLSGRYELFSFDGRLVDGGTLNRGENLVQLERKLNGVFLLRISTQSGVVMKKVLFAN